MACVKPLDAYWAEGGGVVFNPRLGINPRPFALPCGQCVGCRLERSRQWAVRCMHEASCHERSSFVTLTYDQVHVPEDNGLDIEHWQRFCKRARKRFGKFRYFQAGEYGDTTRRPHYHALLFGLDFSHDRVHVRGGDTRLFRSPSLESCWGMGACLIGEVTFESAAYVARYVMKKATGYVQEMQYLRWNEDGLTWWVQPEFSTMSRRPGIGRAWLERWSSDVYPSDDLVVRGKYCRPPKYYDSILSRENPELLAELKEKRRAKAEAQASALSPDRLAAKEKILKSKMRQSSRVI